MAPLRTFRRGVYRSGAQGNVHGNADPARVGVPSSPGWWARQSDDAQRFLSAGYGYRHMSEVEIYTDGACRGNPGPGGWGVLLLAQGREREICGGEPVTTNNRKELTAAIRGLEALKRRCQIIVYTDSEYVRRGISEWLVNWKQRGWKTAAKKPVKNEDLWRQLDEAAERHDIQWRWVRGHDGNPGNERADELANLGLDNGFRDTGT